MVEPLFFESSRATRDELTELFNFVWPTAAAIWHTRGAIESYVAGNPGVGAAAVTAKFTDGSGIHGAGNLKRIICEQSWETQQERLARVLLVDVCAVYESWLSMILADLGAGSRDRETELQSPTDATGSAGVWACIRNLTALESSVLDSAFGAALRSSRKNKKAHLDNLLRCYRYFKECRNSIVHRGAIGNQKAVDAYQEFSAVATPTSLGIKEVPAHEVITLGSPVRLRLRGVVGLSDIVVRMIHTIDAELCRSARSEVYLLHRWKKCHGSRKLLSADPVRRRRQVTKLCGALNLPAPTNHVAFEGWLREKRLVL